MKYEEEARALWQTYVPKRGQADTVQGELMRAVEKLRDEAERNGNMNWGKNHVLLAEYLRDTLTHSGLFDEVATAEFSATSLVCSTTNTRRLLMSHMTA